MHVNDWDYLFGELRRPGTAQEEARGMYRSIIISLHVSKCHTDGQLPLPPMHGWVAGLILPAPLGNFHSSICI